jgi:DNA mismatch repair protein MSH2
MLFADADLDSSPIVVALRMKMQNGIKTVGAAFADASNRLLGVAEYAENDLFANTESLLIQLGAKECLIPADESNADYDLVKLKTVIDRAGCVVTPTRRGEFTPSAIEQDLNRLLKEESAGDHLPEFDLKIALGSMNALLNYLSLLTDDSNFGQFNLTTHDLSHYLRLDHSALRALGVFPEPGQSNANKNASVYGMLNKCKTPQGQRLLAAWLKQPLINAHEIRKRHALVEMFMEDSGTRQLVQAEVLRLMPDLQRNSKRFLKGVATLEDVVTAYQAVKRLPDLIEHLSGLQVTGIEASKLLQATFIQPLQDAQGVLAKLVEMVEATIDLDELSRHRFVIRAEYDDRLTEIRDAIDKVIDDLHEHHAVVRRDLRLDDNKVKLEDSQQYGYCFRVTRNDSKALTDKKTYTALGTTKAGVWFTTRDVKELSNDHIDLKNKYATHQSGLVKQVISVAAGYSPPLEQLNALISVLDVIVCFAHVSFCAPTPYVRPEITEVGANGPLLVRQARHPCLEVQEDLNFIPNDFEMIPDESEFLIITGPNMGGKSTYIRSIGIIALMSQAGCFVPCAEGAQLPVFDAILARVGAGDNQVKGVSTFMAEMLETSTILRLATRDSLIIIDELGRGTSTYDGFGLAWSISEFIATKVRSRCLFASHFAEIVELANQAKHVRNMHCKVHVQPRKLIRAVDEAGATEAVATRQESDITLLYKVEPGTCDRSYGIHVAELAGFPPSVIKLAKRKAEEMEDTTVTGGSTSEADAEEVSPLLSLDASTTEAGMRMVEEFLDAFAKQQDSARASTNKRSRSDEMDSLDELMKTYKDRCMGNAWVRKVLECL